MKDRIDIRLLYCKEVGHSLSHVSYNVNNPTSRSAEYVTDYIEWLEDKLIQIWKERNEIHQ